jgi:hypothetical protein
MNNAEEKMRNVVIVVQWAQSSQILKEEAERNNDKCQ